MHLLRRFALTVAAVLLAACATPRYQTVHRYEPPAGPVAQACVERCDQTQRDCHNRCQEGHAACLKGIEAEVEDRYAEALRRYAAALDRYRFELENYRFNVWLGWGHGLWWYEPWPPYHISLAPAAPGREAIRTRLARERCDDECGCQAGYDACFLACGGKKIPETRCIANCPPAK